MADKTRVDLTGSTAAAGGSARAEFERRRAHDEKRLGRRRPIILAIGATALVVSFLLATFDPAPSQALGPEYRMVYLVFALLVVVTTSVAMFVLPNSTIAWRTGAIGEERTAEFLAPLEAQGFRVIHDRLIPRSRANIDHIVVGPPGVFIVETKNYAGRVRIRGGEVWVAGRRKTEIVAQAKREAAAVAAVIAPTPVTPLLCIYRAELGWFKMEADGVRIVGPREMVKLLRRAPRLLTPDEVTRLANQIDKSLLSALVRQASS